MEARTDNLSYMVKIDGRTCICSRRMLHETHEGVSVLKLPELSRTVNSLSSSASTSVSQKMPIPVHPKIQNKPRHIGTKALTSLQELHLCSSTGLSFDWESPLLSSLSSYSSSSAFATAGTSVQTSKPDEHNYTT